MSQANSIRQGPFILFRIRDRELALATTNADNDSEIDSDRDRGVHSLMAGQE